MKMQFSVFVREHHDGSATINALEAPHVFTCAGSPETAVAWTTKSLAEFVIFARTCVEAGSTPSAPLAPACVRPASSLSSKKAE